MTDADRGPQRYDNPNQEVVREDGSGPGDPSAGDQPPQPPAPEQQAQTDTSVSSDPLDSMTRDQLVAHATDLGIEVPASATKAEIRELINTG